MRVGIFNALGAGVLLKVFASELWSLIQGRSNALFPMGAAPILVAADPLAM
jgi:hypothetical protein